MPWPILDVNGLHFRKWSCWLFMPYISISVMHSAAGLHMEMLVILTEWRPLQIRDRKYDLFSYLVPNHMPLKRSIYGTGYFSQYYDLLYHFNQQLGPWHRKQGKKCFPLELWAGINGTERCTTSLKELDLEQDLLPVGTIIFFTFLPPSQTFLPGNQLIKKPCHPQESHWFANTHPC